MQGLRAAQRVPRGGFGLDGSLGGKTWWVVGGRGGRFAVSFSLRFFLRLRRFTLSLPVAAVGLCVPEGEARLVAGGLASPELYPDGGNHPGGREERGGQRRGALHGEGGPTSGPAPPPLQALLRAGPAQLLLLRSLQGAEDR